MKRASFPVGYFVGIIIVFLIPLYFYSANTFMKWLISLTGSVYMSEFNLYIGTICIGLSLTFTGSIALFCLGMIIDKKINRW